MSKVGRLGEMVEPVADPQREGGESMDRLKAAIDYLINHHQLKLPRTKLVKLLYLADLASYARRGETLTGVDYAYYHYGPYNEAIVRSANELVGDGLNYKQGVRWDGTEYYLYYPGAPDATVDALSPADKQVLDEVATKFGSLPLRDLLDHVYHETEPMKKAQPGDQDIIRAHAGRGT